MNFLFGTFGKSLLLAMRRFIISLMQLMKGSGEQTFPSFRMGSIWWGYFPVFLVALLGLTNTLYFFRQVSDWERQQVTTNFNAASRDWVLVVQREIEFALATTRDIASYFEASPRVGRREFRKFVEPAIKRHAAIKALQWIPVVSREERETFEQSSRLSFPPYTIRQKESSGDIVPATNRDIYLPVLYVQPYLQNKDLLGLDMTSDRTIFELLLRSGDTGELQVSERITLDGESEKRFGFVVSVPVYQSDEDPPVSEEDESAETEPRVIRGFAVGIYNIGDIVELALQNLSVGGIDIHFSDESNNTYLYTHKSRLRSGDNQDEIKQMPSRLVYSQTLAVGGRQWRVLCTPIPGSYQPDAWSGWFVVVGGLSFTLLLTTYVSSLVGRAKKVKQLVDLRTAELSSTNSALNNEIKERKAAEQRLTELNDLLEYRVAVRSTEAERRAKDLEQFAYVASHDLKAPLRAIANLADWISEDLEEKLTEESREQLALLQDRVQRMNALIEGLLEYSRVGRIAGGHSLVDTRELLEEIIDSLSPPKGFTVKLGNDLPKLHTDRLLLGQVFSNLISNGLKHHGGKKGQIKVECRKMRRFYEFSVADNGVGIPAEYHKKVFMIFQTLQAKDYGSNTGIGLALVKKIVEEQGGWITLESQPGKGAKFRFTWPAEPAAKPEADDELIFPV